MRAVLVAVTTVVAASMIGCSHPGSDSSPGSGGSGGAGPGTGGMAGAAGTSGVTGSGGMLGTGGVTGSGGTVGSGGVTGTGGTVGTGGVTGSGGTATGGRSGAGGAAGRGGATGAAGVTGSGGGPMQCVPACPAGYTCDVSGGGICKGGTAANLTFDVKAFPVSGTVTLNGANPVSSTTSCYSSSAGTNYPRGQVTLTDTAHGVSFTADLQGCTNTTATFSTTVFPGTYKVWVSGQYSNLPGDSYLAINALVIGGAVANLAYDVKAFSVSGAVTLNGANPVSSTTSCYSSSAGTNYPRGQVTLTDTTQGVSFTADLQGCTNTTATFSTTVFPGTYEVTITGQYSDLPGASYLAVSRIVVP